MKEYAYGNLAGLPLRGLAGGGQINQLNWIPTSRKERTVPVVAVIHRFGVLKGVLKEYPPLVLKITKSLGEGPKAWLKDLTAKLPHAIAHHHAQPSSPVPSH